MKQELLRHAGITALVVLVAAAFSVNAERVRYDNYHVYRIKPYDEGQLQAIQRLDGLVDSYVFLDGVQNVNAKIDVLVAPQSVDGFQSLLDNLNIPHELLDENAQQELDKEEKIADSNRRSTDYSWEEYHELNDTYNWLHTLATQFPEQVSTFVAGQTYEGREILGVKISYGTGKKAIFLEGGMHAREWIGPATTTYITYQLLTSDDRKVRAIAEAFDWYIVPHANPDGFVFTHTENRLWRKTRTPYGTCFGADPNRNWDFHWNEVGASDIACSDTYAGPSAFSEIETRTLSEYIATLKGKLFLYVSFHSYSQLLLFPYGHTHDYPKNYADLKRVFDKSLSAISKRYGTKYTGGNIYDAIYPASGASLDWAYGELDVPYTYCYELRPPSNYFWIGFRLPAEQIIPTGEETMDSLMAMVQEAGINR